MTVEEKADRWFKEKYGNEGFTDIEEEIRKICFEDGYKECEKEQKECQNFIWESVGFKKRGFVNSIQVAEYIDNLEKELKDASEKVVHLSCNQNKDLKYKLTKAKEFLNEFMRISKASDEDFEHDYTELIGDTEQFLKE
ncbi:MAG: hypothetical protein J6P07_07005 [Spirochaetaceae bacterium]|nr:hypothetical protein [Spirochaetaceae bacterium]MBO7735834.1 hypothetical protein [Methanobrevibacter sp.]